MNWRSPARSTASWRWRPTWAAGRSAPRSQGRRPARLAGAGRPAAGRGSRPQALALAAAIRLARQPSRRLPPLYLGFGLERPLRVQPPAAGRRAAARPRLHHRGRPRLAAVVAALARDARRAAAAVASGRAAALRLRSLQRVQRPSRLDVEGVARAGLRPCRPAGASPRPWRSWRRCRCTDAAPGSARARRAWRRPHRVARAASRLAPTPPATTRRFRPVCSSAASDFFSSTSTIAACVEAARSALRASSSVAELLGLRQHRGLQAGEGKVEVAAVQQRARQLEGRRHRPAPPAWRARARRDTAGPSAWRSCRRPRRRRRRWSRRAFRSGPRRRPASAACGRRTPAARRRETPADRRSGTATADALRGGARRAPACRAPRPARRPRRRPPAARPPGPGPRV